MLNLTRRAALLGAAASSVALVAPVAVALESRESTIPASLRAICAEYERSAIAQRAAERAYRDAREKLDKSLRQADLRVKMTLGTGPADYRPIHANQWPDTIRQEIARLDKVERVEVLANARPVFATFNRLRRQSGLDAADKTDVEARHAYYDAAEALRGYRASTFAEVQLIAATLLSTARATERWYELPVKELLEMLTSGSIEGAVNA